MIIAFGNLSAWAIILPAIASIVGAAAACYIVWQNARNSKLKALCRRSLEDCIAFYRIEERLCRHIAALRTGGLTALAIKRFYRTRQRAEGVNTPSEEATPKRLEEELAGL